MNETELSVREVVIGGIGKAASTSGAAGTELVGLMLPVELRENAIVLIIVVVDPAHRFIAVEQIAERLGLVAEEGDAGVLEV